MKLALPIDVPPTHAWDFAIWATTLAEIEERGYTFACDADDLDSFNYAEVHDPEIGKIFLLQRHHPPICLGVDVMVQADTPTKDALAAMERIFGCREEDYSWITPYSRYPGPGGFFSAAGAAGAGVCSWANAAPIENTAKLNTDAILNARIMKTS